MRKHHPEHQAVRDRIQAALSPRWFSRWTPRFDGGPLRRTRPSRLQHYAPPVIAFVGFVVVGVATVAPALALDPSADRGRIYVLSHCATCHAVARTGPSPWPEAPPFRVLHERYPVEDLAESLAEGIRTGHPSMPEWKLDPGEVGDLIAYLRTLED